MCREGNLYSAAISWLLMRWFSCQESSITFGKFCFVFVLLFPLAMLRNSHLILSDGFVLCFQNCCCCCCWRSERGEKKPEKTWPTDTQQYDFFHVLGPNKWLSRTLFFLNHSAGSRFAELGERFSSSKNVGRTPVNQSWSF